MPSNRSLLSQRILDLITDEWQDVEALMDKAVPLVPPGRALRVYAENKARHDAKRDERIRQGKPAGPRKPEPTERRKQEMGARAVVNELVGGMRERHLIEMEVMGTRRQRRIRRSLERRYAHHCCMHGGTCRGTGDDEPGEDETDPLPELIANVLESRRQREAPPPIPGVREVSPGEIDRLLAEAG